MKTIKKLTVMARRKSVEHLHRLVGNVKDYKDRRVFQLIGFPDENGDFASILVDCTEKSIGSAMKYYGTFSDSDVNIVRHLSVGEYKSWGTEKCMVIRIV